MFDCLMAMRIAFVVAAFTEMRNRRFPPPVGRKRLPVGAMAGAAFVVEDSG